MKLEYSKARKSDTFQKCLNFNTTLVNIVMIQYTSVIKIILILVTNSNISSTATIELVVFPNAK